MSGAGDHPGEVQRGDLGSAERIATSASTITSNDPARASLMLRAIGGIGRISAYQNLRRNRVTVDFFLFL